MTSTLSLRPVPAQPAHIGRLPASAVPSKTPAEARRLPPLAVAIGASAGGVSALLELLVPLPANYRPSLIVVLHMPEHRRSGLTELFASRMRMPTREAEDKMPIDANTLYFAPAGYHLLVEAGHTFALSCDEPVLFSRPSIDVLFDSAAFAWRDRLAGVVLTGASSDGAAGLLAIKNAGGYTAVQEPSTAQIATMPQAAIDLAAPHYIAPIAGLHDMLLQFNMPIATC